MFKATIASTRFFLLVIVLGLSFGFGFGSGLAGADRTVEAQAPGQEGEAVEERPNQPQTAFYHRILGWSFLPLESAWEYTYTAGGCVYRPSDGETFNHQFAYNFHLPHGAEITTFNLYFYDTSPSDLEVNLYAYPNQGAPTFIADASTTASVGYGVTNSGVFSHTVNNLAESLGFITSFPPFVDSNIQICSIRITYQYDISSNYLPAVLNLSSP